MYYFAILSRFVILSYTQEPLEYYYVVCAMYNFIYMYFVCARCGVSVFSTEF